MRNFTIFTLLMVFSLGVLADDHRSDHDGKARHHKDMFKQADQDGDGAVSAEEHEQALAEWLISAASVSRKWIATVMALSLEKKPVRPSRSAARK